MAKKTKDQSEKENLHKDHRKRLRALLETSDINTISDVTILEYLLTLAIPQGNTNDEAHRLLNKFGSILASIEADPTQLVEIRGIGPKVASFLKIISKVFRKIFETAPFTKGHVHLETPNEIVSFFYRFFVQKNCEEFYIACLTARDDLIAIEKISSGTANSVSLELNKVYAILSTHKPNKIILAHNHPNGTANPSADDFDTTAKIVDIANVFSTFVADHIILADEQYLSFNRCGYLDEIRTRKANGNAQLSNKLLEIATNSFSENKSDLCLSYPDGIGGI